ncbi:MAG: ribonuclease T2 [Stappiaceae bacterium]
MIYTSNRETTKKSICVLFSCLLFLITFGKNSIAAEKAGDFDYFVLSLSWSPSYCAANGSRANKAQCASGRPYAFVVHGLWPQYEKGWPDYCKSRFGTWIDSSLIERMLPIMPSKPLVIHQWRKHGTCSGLSPEDYFKQTERAMARVKIPPAFSTIKRHVTVSPDKVEKAFRVANPGLNETSIAVTCDKKRLREVRICFDKDLDFRPCKAVDNAHCRAKSVVMPPIRSR